MRSPFAAIGEFGAYKRFANPVHSLHRESSTEYGNGSYSFLYSCEPIESPKPESGNDIRRDLNSILSAEEVEPVSLLSWVHRLVDSYLRPRGGGKGSYNSVEENEGGFSTLFFPLFLKAHTIERGLWCLLSALSTHGIHLVDVLM